MKTDASEFRTKKGHLVFKRSRVVHGKRLLAEEFSLRVMQDGSRYYFKLGRLKKEAGEKADEIMAFLSVGGNTVAKALLRYSEPHKARALRAEKAPKPAEAILTVDGMVQAFLAVTTHLSPVTRRNNTQALRHIAAGILGLPKLGIDQTKVQRAEWLAKVGPFPIAGFTVQDVEIFRQRELAAVGTDNLKRGSTSTTLNSYLRAARGIFSKKLLPHYSHLNLPEAIPFRSIAPLPEPSHRYNSKIDAETLIEDAKKTLYPNDKIAWIILLLCLGAGLRREEIDKLEWEQIDLEARRIWIRTTQFFRPKAKNSESYVDISEAVAHYLEEFKNLGDNGKRRFVIPGAEIGGKIRSQKYLRALMTWLRSRGVSPRTPLHTLRKEAGSMIFKEGGSIDRTAEFLRNDPRVAREHYIGRKERIELKLPGL